MNVYAENHKVIIVAFYSELARVCMGIHCVGCLAELRLEIAVRTLVDAAWVASRRVKCA